MASTAAVPFVTMRVANSRSCFLTEKRETTRFDVLYPSELLCRGIRSRHLHALAVISLIILSRPTSTNACRVAMFFCKRPIQLSLESIGRRFGGLDHSTVIHACRAVQARTDTDPGFKIQVELIGQHLQARVPGIRSSDYGLTL
ncbi:MAG: hypothetical protein IH951_03050 [Bacteroidetes bacterium]|nr:hypothetical protein [Bacteroidota bacterium]